MQECDAILKIISILKLEECVESKTNHKAYMLNHYCTFLHILPSNHLDSTLFFSVSYKYLIPHWNRYYRKHIWINSIEGYGIH